MALIPFNHPNATPSLSSKPASSTSSTHSRPSSYTIRQSPPAPTSTHSRHGERRPNKSTRSFSTSSNSSSSSSSSSAATSISSYTSISTRTFGTYSRPGYAPGQAPHDYFYNEEVREEWDCAPFDGKGRRVRRGLRVGGGGSGGNSGSGSGWSGFGDDAPFGSSSFFGRSGGFGGEMGGRRDSVFSDSERSGSGSGSSRFVGDARGGEEDWENDTVSPADSISQVSSSPSARRSGFERGPYQQSRVSERPCAIENGMRELQMGSGGGSRVGRSGAGTISLANGRLVRIEAPGRA